MTSLTLLKRVQTAGVEGSAGVKGEVCGQGCLLEVRGNARV